jgi:hypothetical protein
VINDLGSARDVLRWGIKTKTFPGHCRAWLMGVASLFKQHWATKPALLTTLNYCNFFLFSFHFFPIIY